TRQLFDGHEKRVLRRVEEVEEPRPRTRRERLETPLLEWLLPSRSAAKAPKRRRWTQAECPYCQYTATAEARRSPVTLEGAQDRICPRCRVAIPAGVKVWAGTAKKPLVDDVWLRDRRRGALPVKDRPARKKAHEVEARTLACYIAALARREGIEIKPEKELR